MTYHLQIALVAVAVAGFYFYSMPASKPSYNPDKLPGPTGVVPSGAPGEPSTDPATIRSPESESQPGASDATFTY